MSAPRNLGRKASSPFDRLINQQCQKGVAGSKPSLGRWGITSFTPLRNGSSTPEDVHLVAKDEKLAVLKEPPTKKKKFFTSRNKSLAFGSDNSSIPSSQSDETPKVPPLKLKLTSNDEKYKCVNSFSDSSSSKDSADVATLEHTDEEEKTLSLSPSNPKIMETFISLNSEVKASPIDESILNPSSPKTEILVPESKALTPIVEPRKKIKKSIFTSKKSPRKATYRHTFRSDVDEFSNSPRNPIVSSSSSTLDQYHEEENDFGPESSRDFDPKTIRRCTKTLSESLVTSVKCLKGDKEYFTVIKNVKKAHQIQDSGEFQEFNDDVDYILDGLGNHHGLSTRCLSLMTLATKCMDSPFRMHLRAHGTVTKFFREIKDAPDSASLSLCAATVLFVLSQDRLNMDLDRDSLELMLNLLESDSQISLCLEESRELEKNKNKVGDLVSGLKGKTRGGTSEALRLESLTAEHLAMETLLSLTSKRAGEWFKEELRELGGLDHLIRTLCDIVSYLKADEISLWTEELLNKLRKGSRVCKVLENVTHENETNVEYILKYEKGNLVKVLSSLFSLLDYEIQLCSNSEWSDKESSDVILVGALMDVLRLLINLAHDYGQVSFGSSLLGSQEGIFESSLHCLFLLPSSFPQNKVFDVSVLSLSLLINLVETSSENRNRLASSKSPREEYFFDTKGGVASLVSLFIAKESSARHEETKTDNLLDGVPDENEEETEKNKSQEEFINDTVSKLLHKAGRHMEDTLIASYITMIIGYLILDNKNYENMVREFLPHKNFEIMVSTLKKFFNFMNLTASASIASSRGIKSTEKIIHYLETIDKSQVLNKVS